MRIAAVALLPVLLTSCVVSQVASTAVDVATLPVKVVSKTVDLATTSQSEADQKRGREMRKMADRCRRGQPLPTDSCAAPMPR